MKKKKNIYIYIEVDRRKELNIIKQIAPQKCRLLLLFFLTCLHKRRNKIRTSDLRFMRRGLQPIKLPLGDSSIV
jgi:hypothetical protein